jgi:hypothetical protein
VQGGLKAGEQGAGGNKPGKSEREGFELHHRKLAIGNGLFSMMVD